MRDEKYFKSFVKSIALLIFLSTSIALCYSQTTINSGSSVNFTISETIISEAGNDFPPVFSTSANETVISIAILPENVQNTTYENWSIDIKKSDIDWHNDILLSIKRTGSGTTNYGTTLIGGTVYQQIQNTDNSFFNGTGWITDIPLQYQITGISVTIPAKLYSTEVVFTLMDN